MRAVVVGAGMGGLGAAIALEQQGHEVVIVERSEAAATGGVGIAVGPNALAALGRLGAVERVLARGNTAGGRRVYDWTGRKLSEGPWKGGVVRRADLHAALAGRLRTEVEYGRACVGVAGARAGIDDLLYDYVRRPDGPLSSMSFPGLQGSPSAAIVAFLRETRLALRPYRTYLGVSVFGVSATRPDEVAQDIPEIARQADYVAPMVYPSHWGPGEYNVGNPNPQPYEIVARSLRDFQRDTRDTGARVVPWLQDFTLGVTYGPAEVRAQIDAARHDGINEFLLWDPNVTYTSDALTPDARPFPRAGKDRQPVRDVSGTQSEGQAVE